MNKTTFTVQPDNKSLVMERQFNVPSDKLWSAYADANLLAQWFSPKGWSTEVKSHVFENGGEYVYIMKCEDESQGEWFGKTSAGKMIFNNVMPKTSFAYTDYFTNDEGEVNKDMPSAHNTVELVEVDPETTLLKVTTSYSTEEELKQVIEMGMQEGYTQTLDKLEELLTQ